MKKLESKPFHRLELKFKALINHDKDFLIISRDFIERTLKDLYYLRTFHKELSTKEDNFESLQAEMQILQSRVQNQDSLIKTLDMAYMDKMNDLKTEIDDLKEEKEQLKLGLNTQIIELQQENDKLRGELEILTENLEKKATEIEVITVEKSELSKKLKELENLKDYKQIDPNALKSEWLSMESEEKIKLILQSSIAPRIFQFLRPKDVFSLSLLNKTIFQWFSFNGIQYRYALKHNDRFWDNKIKELKYKMAYFQRLSDKIPEEFLKNGIVRFICFKEKLGDYMTPILHEAQKLAFLSSDEENPKNIQKASKPLKYEKPSNSLIENMNQTIAKLFPTLGAFIRTELFQTVGLESKEMVARSFEKSNEITNNLKLKFPEFSEAFCKSFAKLLVFGAMLLQDAKV